MRLAHWLPWLLCAALLLIVAGIALLLVSRSAELHVAAPVVAPAGVPAPEPPFRLRPTPAVVAGAPLPPPLCEVYISSGTSPEPLGREATFAVGEPHAYWMVCPVPIQYPELIWGTRAFGVSGNITMQPVPDRPGVYAMEAAFPAAVFSAGDVMVTYAFADGALQGTMRVTVAAGP